jgi:hypothetical protein
MPINARRIDAPRLRRIRNRFLERHKVRQVVVVERVRLAHVPARVEHALVFFRITWTTAVLIGDIRL